MLVLSLLSTACSSDGSGRRAPPTSTGVDESFLDESAEPCTDFYQYACGSWIAQHDPGAGYVDERFVNGDQRNDIYFDDLLGGKASAADDLANAIAFHEACMSLRGGDDSDFGTPNALVSEIGKAETMADLVTVVAHLHQAGISALFGAASGIDRGNPASHIVQLYSSGWSLPTPDRYAPLTDQYESHITALAALYDGVKLDPAVVFAVESQIAGASLSVAMSRDETATYNPTSVTDLETRVSSFDWAGYLALRGFTGVSSVDVTEPQYFDALEALFESQSIDHLKQYLVWRVLETTADGASLATIHEEANFHDYIVDGQTEPQPDWYVCLAATRAYYGTSMAHAFVQEFVSDDTVDTATRFVTRIRAALAADLGDLSWLDDDSRAVALAKLDALIQKIGYPDGWMGRPEPVVSPSGSFLQDYMGARHDRIEDAVQQFSTPVDRNEWTATPDTTNAFYDPLRNSITIPVAILEDPFFSRDWASSSNYGVLGQVIGHELTHGFDDQGRLFDGTGKLGKYWSDSADAEFQQRESCLVDQFNAYEPAPGLHVDGNATLGENIADLGGLKLAHLALQKVAEDRSPSLKFDREQAFFVAYAQSWCAAESPEALASQLATDVHSPARYRVNGVLQNLPEFASAFQCSRGAKMAPKNRCSVW